MNNQILDDVLKEGKETIKRNIMLSLEAVADDIADEFYETFVQMLKLEKENFELRKKLKKAGIK